MVLCQWRKHDRGREGGFFLSPHFVLTSGLGFVRSGALGEG